MKLRLVTPLLLIGMLISAAFCQNPATQGTAAGRYGLSAWAITGQRVASQFNPYVDSTFQSGVGGTFTFAASACTMNLAGNKNIIPFAANASVKIVDINSAATETVNGVAPSFSGSTCTLNLSPSNTHTAGSFILRSGTCGLREALNDMGNNGGTVIVDQKFYDDGCTAATITGLTLTAGAGLQANQYIEDISNGQNTYYKLGQTAMALTAAPTALTTVGGAAATLSTSTSGGAITNGAAIRAGITCVDAIGRETPLSVDTSANAVVTTGAGSTNSITVVAPGSTGCPNSVGYRVYLSAAAGATLTEILYAPSAAGCTASLNSIVVGSCALTSNSVVTALVTATAGIPISGVVSGGSGATLVGYVSSAGLPPTPAIQTVYGPFPAITTVTTVQNAAEIVLPAGFFNQGLLKTYRVCAQGQATAAAATLTGNATWTLGPRQATGVQSVAVTTFYASTLFGAASNQWSWCTDLTTEATGATGQLFPSAVVGFCASPAAAAAIIPCQLENTDALSTAQDLTQQLYLDLRFTATASSFTTLTVQKVSIQQVN